MSSTPEVAIRALVASDLAPVLSLWSRTEGLGLNESDTPEALRQFLDRNPGFSAIAVSADGTAVGAVLCGHDGRRGSIHHLAVAKPWRRQGIARRLLDHCLAGLAQAKITRCNIFLFHDNEEGARFWTHLGWEAVVTWRTLQRRVAGAA
jgi:putative acetyltransferase